MGWCQGSRHHIKPCYFRFTAYCIGDNKLGDLGGGEWGWGRWRVVVGGWWGNSLYGKWLKAIISSFLYKEIYKPRLCERQWHVGSQWARQLCWLTLHKRWLRYWKGSNWRGFSCCAQGKNYHPTSGHQVYMEYLHTRSLKYGLILGLHPANERRRHKVIPSLIGGV